MRSYLFNWYNRCKDRSTRSSPYNCRFSTAGLKLNTESVCFSEFQFPVSFHYPLLIKVRHIQCFIPSVKGHLIDRKSWIWICVFPFFACCCNSYYGMEAYNITDISHIYVYFINSLLEESEKVWLQLVNYI